MTFPDRLGRPGQRLPEAPIKPTAEAYVKGAFTTLFCIAISDGAGVIQLKPDQRVKLGQITAQAVSRPRPTDSSYRASVTASEMWFQAAQASLGMFRDPLQKRPDGTPRGGQETLDIWRNSLYLAAGITGNEGNHDVQDKKNRLDMWLQKRLAGNPATEVLPIWCSPRGGFSSEVMTNIQAARKLYTDLWDFSWQSAPQIMEHMFSQRRG